MRRAVLLAFGLFNSWLYSGLLPLWEGWDEPFHYGYVQELSRQVEVPAMGKTVLSREIVDSFDLAPMAEGVRKNLSRSVTFGEYFRLAQADREEMRRKLDRIDAREGSRPSQSPNYEAHQPPLAYLLLAPLDRLWAQTALPSRILRLRLVCSSAAVLLTFLGVLWLCALLGLPALYADAALFLVFASQMFYATAAHIANDWLAAPLFTVLIAQGVSLYRAPRLRSALRFALIFAAALLTKAYFLAITPLALGIAIACRRRASIRHLAIAVLLLLGSAGPWYARNFAHGNLSGMQETRGGAPIGGLARAAVSLPWLRTIWSTAHTALWTGNNTYLAFSALTLNFMLVLLLVAAVVYGRQRKFAPGERIVAGGILLFSFGLAYATVVFFWASHGAASTPAPWYCQAIWPTSVVLLMLALGRGGRSGRWVAIAMLALWAYTISLTYIVKLIPYYAGLSDGRAHLADLPGWLRSLPAGSALDTDALLPPGVLLLLTAWVLAGGLGIAARLCYGIATVPQSISSCQPRHFEGN